MTHSETSMTVLDAIRARRSVRSYAPEKVERAPINTLLAAAVRAPTAVHKEPWAFVILQDRDMLKRLSDRAKPLFVEEVHRAQLDRGGHALDIFASPDFNIFYDAGTLIIIGAQANGPLLAALNLPDVKAELGIPVEFTAVAPIVVGVPRGETPATPRKEPRILAWR